MRYLVPLALMLCVALTSCKKKVLEIVPVLQVEKDMSIAGAGDIKFFDFPEGQVGYAASDTTFIYKTLNGGASWEKIEIGDGGKCRAIDFFDATNGMVLMGLKLYITQDGGDTWEMETTGVIFSGISDTGIGAYIKDCNYPSCSVMTTNNMGASFQETGSLNHGEVWYEITGGRMTGNSMVLIHSDSNFDDILYGYNLELEESFSLPFDNITAYVEVTDLFLSGESEGAIVGEGGTLQVRTQYFSGSYSFSQQVIEHSYDYYGVDGRDGLIVAVGEQMITSNIDIQTEYPFNPVFDSDGNGFTETFYAIEFYATDRFYLSGENGLILKAKL